MGIKNLVFCFNNQRLEYYNGETLQVRVQFFVDSPTKLNSLKVKVKGIATTRWEKQRGNTTYIGTGEEIYFDNTLILLQKPASQDLQLGIGQYNYEFSFDIPNNIPPTYYGKKGQIEYSVKAIVDQPWKYDNSIKSLFVVKQLLDLNEEALINPNIKEPAIVQLEETYCCCWHRGKTSVMVKLPYRAFTRGQKVPLQIDIDNASNVHVDGLNYSIIQRDTFFTTLRGHKKMKEECLVQHCITRNVQARTSDNFVYELCVPDIPFVNLRHCQVIDVDYVLKFELSADTVCTFPVEFPITFVTVPLRELASAPLLIDPPSYDEALYN